MKKFIALFAASVIVVPMSSALGLTPKQATGGSPGKHQKGHIENQAHPRQHTTMSGKRRHITSHPKRKHIESKVHGKRKHDKAGHAAGTGRKG
jgi:hypothetical protein